MLEPVQPVCHQARGHQHISAESLDPLAPRPGCQTSHMRPNPQPAAGAILACWASRQPAHPFRPLQLAQGPLRAPANVHPHAMGLFHPTGGCVDGWDEMLLCGLPKVKARLRPLLRLRRGTRPRARKTHFRLEMGGCSPNTTARGRVRVLDGTNRSMNSVWHRRVRSAGFNPAARKNPLLRCLETPSIR